jgi:hypothetical protein
MDDYQQRRQCLAALNRAYRYLNLNSPDTLHQLVLARHQIDATIKTLCPRPRRRRATVALFAAVGAVLFVGAPIGLQLLTQDRPAVEDQR